MPNVLDLAGKRFGRLVVIERTKVSGARNAMWRCQCDCGNFTTAAASNLGKQKFSCGCFQTESARSSLAVNRLARDNLHGMSQTDEWRIWSKIKTRCYNPNTERYPNYGGRGIKMCRRWLNSFEDFYADMGPRPSKRHSIERKNTNKNYEPSNCKWATPKEQARNTTRNNFITINGETKCILEWCEKLGVPQWKPYEMARATGAKRNGPPKFPSPEDAIRYLHSISSA